MLFHFWIFHASCLPAGSSFIFNMASIFSTNLFQEIWHFPLLIAVKMAWWLSFIYNCQYPEDSYLVWTLTSAALSSDEWSPCTAGCRPSCACVMEQKKTHTNNTTLKGRDEWNLDSTIRAKMKFNQIATLSVHFPSTTSSHLAVLQVPAMAPHKKLSSRLHKDNVTPSAGVFLHCKTHLQQRQTHNGTFGMTCTVKTPKAYKPYCGL